MRIWLGYISIAQSNVVESLVVDYLGVYSLRDLHCWPAFLSEKRARASGSDSQFWLWTGATKEAPGKVWWRENKQAVPTCNQKPVNVQLTSWICILPKLPPNPRLSSCSLFHWNMLKHISSLSKFLLCPFSFSRHLKNGWQAWFTVFIPWLGSHLVT